MSAPPMEQAQFQQAMPAVPPSYDAAMSSGGYPPGPPGQMYPPLPEKAGGPPPPQAMQPQPPVQVVTQVQYVQGPSFGHRAVTMVCPHCQKNITTRTSSEPSA